jgi:hypothetical protein
MTRRTLLALPLVATTARPKLGTMADKVWEIDPDWWKPMMLVDVARPALSLDQLKAAFLALPLNDRVTFALWADNAHRVLSGKDDVDEGRY